MRVTHSLTAMTSTFLTASLSYCSYLSPPTVRMHILQAGFTQLNGVHLSPSPADIVYALMGPLNHRLAHPNLFFKTCFKSQFQKKVPLGTWLVLNKLLTK